MIRLRAVGECVIDVGGERVGPDAELAFALLLVLTLADGRPLGRRQLTDLLWPATTEARAAMEGRSVPDLDDVRSVALAVLRHRVVLNFQAEAEGTRVEQLIPLARR